MKKIYYVPGLISALVIPVLFLYYINPHIDKTSYNVIDMGLPSKLEKDKSNYPYTFEPLRNWNYRQIRVEPNKAKENSNLYVSEIKALQKKNQKETGIEFILDKNNSYADFVSLLNDMAVAKHDTYCLDIEKTGHLFATINYIDPDAKKLEYECLLCNDVITDYEDPYIKEATLNFLTRQFYSTFFEDISKLPKGAYYIISGFLFFINISMLSIKRFQLQRSHS